LKAQATDLGIQTTATRNHTTVEELTESPAVEQTASTPPYQLNQQGPETGPPPEEELLD
jgi:hypothetical protein